MKEIRQDFPILSTKMNNHPLIYFDNAATSQKPQSVIDTLNHYYTNQNVNIHRGIIYSLGEQTTALYEESREKVAKFLNADPEEIVFTRGATDGINTIAFAYGIAQLKAHDEILLTELEHLSNLIPWQQVAHRTGARLQFIPIFPDGSLDFASIDKLINKKTKIISMVHVSNVTGTHVPVEKIIKLGKSVGAVSLIDATQSAPHQKIDVKKMGCDFLSFSGHKLIGPTGIGILYVNKQLHNIIQPYQFGGGMVYHADFHTATFVKMPHKLEAGTPPIAQAIGMKAAIEYVEKKISLTQLQPYEAKLTTQLIEGLSLFKKVKIWGPIEQLKKVGHLVTFSIDGIHGQDIAKHLSDYGICVRTGDYSASTLVKKMGISSSVRVSFYAYNTAEEVDTFLKILEKIF